MLTTQQVADMWNVKRNWVIVQCRIGAIPSEQIEGRWFIHRSVAEHCPLRPRKYQPRDPLHSVTHDAMVGT